MLLTFSFSSIYAQQTFYQKTITNKKQPVDWTGGTPYIVKQTLDRGLIFCGIYDAGPGNNNMFLKKTDSNFVTQWSFGLVRSSNPVPYSLIHTKDQGFLMAGAYTDAPGSNTAFVLRLNSNGKLVWQKYFKKGTVTEAYSVSEGPSGSVFVCGKSDTTANAGSQFWVTKIENDGTVSLNKIYNLNSDKVYQTQIVSTTAKAFAVVGRSGTNSFLMKADSLGNPVWTNLISEDLTAYHIDLNESKNKELTVAASRGSDLLTFKFNKSGALKWSKLISTTGNIELNDLYQLSSGNFIIAATVSGAPSAIDMLKLDNAGGNLIAAKNLKTTAGKTYGFINTLSVSNFTLTGWDASAGTNYINIMNFDSSLINCTDVAASVTVSDYTLNYTATPSVIYLPGLSEPGVTVSSTSWVNATTAVDTVCSEDVLPLSLIRFALSKNGAANVLSWSTAQEINTSYFEIQRSTDSRTFTAVGKVTAAGKATQNDYQFTDANPLNGTNYYRLKIADADGKFTYSAYVWASNSGSANIIIYPNPVKDRIVIKVNSLVKTDYNVAVTDMQGRVILRTTLNAVEGATVKEINAASLKQGTYFVKIQNEEGSQVIKIVK